MTNFEVHLEGGVGPLPSELQSSGGKYDATSYMINYSKNTLGSNLVGRSCPSCKSPLVIRVNAFDSRRFVACDKTNKPYCKFSIGLTETIGERTARITHKLNRRK